ncbi:hypothetical protein [Bosea sp. BIWAKO-01]|nr:hypothetical protein [Bosea sp. BIWAKO-01]GAU86389.1 hypothetical protein BIWAKO_06337 [Bosea sp. BIWAKO-01]
MFGDAGGGACTTFRLITVYVMITIIDFAHCFDLTQWSRRLERRLHVAP